MNLAPRLDQTINYRRKQYTIKGIKRIVRHGEFYINKTILAEILVVGQRGALYIGWVYNNGHITLNDKNGRWPFDPQFGEYEYDGQKGELKQVAHNA